MNYKVYVMSLALVVGAGISVEAMGNEVQQLNPEEELFEGARTGSLMLIERALVRGADCNAKNTKGMTALQVTACKGKAECLRYLISQGADVRSRDTSGNTVLHCASLGGNGRCLREVLDNPEIVFDGLEIKNNQDMTALCIAAVGGHVECLKELLSKGACIEVWESHFLDSPSSVSSTALHWAAQGGSLDCVRELLSRGADVKMVDSIGRTALHYAAYCGRLDCLKILLDWGTAIDIKSTDGSTALHFAAQGNKVTCLREILSRGINIRAQDAAGNTALHDVYLNYHTDECLNELLSKGAQLETRNNKGETVLHKAVYHNRSVCIKDLLKRGAVCDSQDTSFRIVLHSALKNCQVESIRVLLLAKAQILIYGSSCHVLAQPKQKVLAARTRLKAGLLCLCYAQSDSTKPKLKHPAGADISTNKHLYSELFLSHSSTREDVLIVLLDAMAKGKNVDYPLFHHALDDVSEYLVSKLSQLLQEMKRLVLVGSSQELRVSLMANPEDKQELLKLFDQDRVQQIFKDLIAKALRVRFRELMSSAGAESRTTVVAQASKSTELEN